MVPLEASSSTVASPASRKARLVCAGSAFEGSPVPRQIARPTAHPRPCSVGRPYVFAHVLSIVRARLATEACLHPKAALRWARSFRRRAGSGMKTEHIVATFSIVAFDPGTDSLGVAVQSKFLAVGSVVPWARAGVGAVATQAMANYNYGPWGSSLWPKGTPLMRPSKV